MKTPVFVKFCLIATGALFLTACNSFEKRAEQKSATFNSLDESTQQRLKEGNINVGDTPDMVYIALSVPDAKRQRVTSDGRETIWVYKNFYQDYQGTELVGYRRYFVPVSPNRYLVRYETVRRDVYNERSEEHMRITFMNGAVKVIEQMQQ